jgi:hypothetical protein
LVEAKLQYKLSRIYADAGDAEMESQTAAKALEIYLHAYTPIDIPRSQGANLRLDRRALF